MFTHTSGPQPLAGDSDKTRGPSGRNRSSSLSDRTKTRASVERIGGMAVLRVGGGCYLTPVGEPWRVWRRSADMLSGKRALVTGSSQGIGPGVARAFAANGAAVVLTSEKPL